MCDNQDHDQNDHELFEAIRAIETPEQVASACLQIFGSIASTLAEIQAPNPVVARAFPLMKLLAEQLNDQELSDLLALCEMEHSEAILKYLSKSRHPAGKRRKWGK